MRRDRWKLVIGILLFAGAFSGGGLLLIVMEQEQNSWNPAWVGKGFSYILQKKLGVPILKASIKIENWIFPNRENPFTRFVPPWTLSNLDFYSG